MLATKYSVIKDKSYNKIVFVKNWEKTLKIWKKLERMWALEAFSPKDKL